MVVGWQTLDPWLAFALYLLVYAGAAYRGGWQMSHPANCVLRWQWWATHVLVYFVLISLSCFVPAAIVRTVVRYSPLATENDWPWRLNKIAGDLPFAVEYRRAKALCAEYDKRLLFKSGKRVGLPIDTCGYGPFEVYRLKSGEYCLVDGYDRLVGNRRFLRVNVEKETVELRFGAGWFKIPEKGCVSGWGGGTGLDFFSFDMYDGDGDRDLNHGGWSVDVKGTEVGDSLDGMTLIGHIATSGKFRKCP